MSSYVDYSDNEPYSSDEDENEYEYEIPLCFCGKDAKLRISTTEKNYLRPFFNCSKRNFNKQCGFFVWENELYSDESDDESSYVCDDCLEKEREIDEIESARGDDKASRDRENQSLTGKVKDEPLDQDGLANDTPSIVKVKHEPFDQDGLPKDTMLAIKVKDEPLGQDGLANDTPLTVKVKDEPLDQGGPVNDAPLVDKVKDEPLDQDGSANDTPLTVKVKDEPLDQGGPVNDAPLVDKVKDEPLDQGGPTNDGLLIDKVKNEPLDQDHDLSRDKAESVCVKCGCLKLKRRVVEIKIGRDENKVSCNAEKVVMLTKLETAESELCQIKKESKGADDKQLSAVESELGQISKNTKLGNMVDQLPDTDESEIHHIRKKTKLAHKASSVMRSEMLSNLEKESDVSESVQVKKETELANEGDDVPQFEAGPVAAFLQFI